MSSHVLAVLETVDWSLGYVTTSYQLKNLIGRIGMCDLKEMDRMEDLGVEAG
jgi:hypothetical protein